MNNIEYRRLGATGVQVPAMGVGTQSWGKKEFGYGKSYTRDDLFGAYKTSLDAGIRFFDTSESYASGLCEQLLGEFRRQDGRPIVVASKFTPHKLYDPSDRRSHTDIMPTLDGSLQRLGIDAVDLYQLHYPVPRPKLDAYLAALAETVKVGKAKYIGVSNFGVADLRYAHEFLARQGIPLASNQAGYSLLNRQPETDGMFATCKELDIAFIPILPLSEGVLTGAFRTGGIPVPLITKVILRMMRLFETGAPFIQRMFTKPYTLQFEKIEPLFQVMDKIAQSHNASLAQVALNWLITSNPLVIPIPGPKTAQEAADNAATLSWKITPAQFELISQTEADIRRSLAS
jgi:aryl-alcohol dehydrogenase-like predicted oxidoreductase